MIIKRAIRAFRDYMKSDLSMTKIGQKYNVPPPYISYCKSINNLNPLVLEQLEKGNVYVLPNGKETKHLRTIMYALKKKEKMK